MSVRKTSELTAWVVLLALGLASSSRRRRHTTGRSHADASASNISGDGEDPTRTVSGRA